MQRPPRKSPNTIRIKWGCLRDGNPDICVSWGEGVPKCDARYAINMIDKLTEELILRGYDQTTLRFEIKMNSSHKTPAPYVEEESG